MTLMLLLGAASEDVEKSAELQTIALFLGLGAIVEIQRLVRHRLSRNLSEGLPPARDPSAVARRIARHARGTITSNAAS